MSKTASDYGTKERHARGKVVVRAVAPGPGYATTDAAMDLHVTVLDQLYEQGRLGDNDDAKRRFEAGEWLMKCYVSAGLNQSVTMRYSPLGREGGEDMSDAQAWNRKTFNEALRAMGMYSRIVSGAVIGGVYRPSEHEQLLDGLDRLADFRGM